MVIINRLVIKMESLETLCCKEIIKHPNLDIKQLPRMVQNHIEEVRIKRRYDPASDYHSYKSVNDYLLNPETNADWLDADKLESKSESKSETYKLNE